MILALFGQRAITYPHKSLESECSQMVTPSIIAYERIVWVSRGLQDKSVMVTVQGDGLPEGSSS